MDFEKLDNFMAQDEWAAILLGGRGFFSNGQHGGINLVDKLAPAELRIEAVNNMGSSHNIGYYPILREAAMTDPDSDVRKAIRAASDALEEEFGEEACLNADLEFTGGITVNNSEEAHVSGNFMGANLNDFR